MRKHSTLTKSQREARLHYYKQFRANGYTALAAWTSAMSTMFFRVRLRDMVATDKRRSAAAKKAAKTRKANRRAA